MKDRLSILKESAKWLGKMTLALFFATTILTPLFKLLYNWAAWLWQLIP